MHSFHHSDRSLNASTTERHFWLEFLIKSVSIYPLVALLFKTCPLILTIYFLASYWHFIVHANLRFSLGRCWPLLNTPHYHRIHHSAQPEHHDANFASLFPIYDWLFRTTYRARTDEYPPTGLDTGDLPKGAVEALLWPWRHRLRQQVAAKAAITR